MFFDPLYLLFMAPGLLLALWAQSRVRGTFQRFSQVPTMNRMTGARAARAILDNNGLQNVAIEPVAGALSDHYDPRSRTLRLSEPVYGVASVAAVGVAAHEAGHAIQHARAYAPLTIRTAIVPAVNIGSNLGLIVLIIGLVIGSIGLGWIGVGLFALATLFALITLPVEFDATRRAKVALRDMGLVDIEEGQGVAKVLNAAAWTYIAGFLTSLLSLLYYVMLLTGMSRRGEE